MNSLIRGGKGTSVGASKNPWIIYLRNYDKVRNKMTLAQYKKLYKKKGNNIKKQKKSKNTYNTEYDEYKNIREGNKIQNAIEKLENHSFELQDELDILNSKVRKSKDIKQRINLLESQLEEIDRAIDNLRNY